MRIPLSINLAHWLRMSLLILFLSACNGSGEAPGTYVVLVTQIVPVTQIIPKKVTQVVRVTQIVQVLEPTALPATVAPATRAPLAPTAIAPPIAAPATIAPATAAPATSAPAPAVPVFTETPLPAVNGVLVWYDFEGDFLSSGVVPDRSGHGYEARLVGSVETSNGISGGQAIFFNGNGYIQANSNPAAGRNKVTFSLWFKTDNPQNNYKLASGAWWNGGPGSGWIMATHIPEFWSNDTKGVCWPDITNIDNNFPAGKWIHELVTYDGKHIREYTNGQLINDWPTTGAAIGDGEPMAIGAWPEFQGFNFQGSIDEFQMFGRALSAGEVQEIYASGR